LVAGKGNYAGADLEAPDEVESESSFEETMGALMAELAMQMKEVEELDKEIKIWLLKVGFEL
jgi:type I restriction enzyme M protein